MTDIEVIQALFDTKPMGMAMNWPVDVERFVHAVKEIRALHAHADSSPADICEQWRKATGALGVDAMGNLFLERGEWQRLAYAHAADRKPWREHDDYVVIWEQPAGCVLVKVHMHGDDVDRVTFDVRPTV